MTGRAADSGTNLYVTATGTVEMIHRWDFNNDGYLDLFIGQNHNELETVNAFIYWGSEEGPRSLQPDVPGHQPLARWLKETRRRRQHLTRLPSLGGGRSLLVDLDQDGYLEIVFCNFVHNYSEHMNAFIYWGSPTGYRPERRTELPTLLASGLAAADFDQDGFVDLAFSNQGIEGADRFGYDQHLESYIYWNGPRGFSPARRSSIPSVSAFEVTAGDLNRDGFPELLFLNNNAEEKSLYLYWGSPDGFSVDRREVWKGGDPKGAHLSDLTGDGHPELILTHGDDRAAIHQGSQAGLQKEAWIELPTQGAIEAQTGDLNRDGHPDIVLANGGEATHSYIYWGGPAGYGSRRRTELPTLGATSASLADFNSDGWIDLAFANAHDSRTNDVASYLYWNGPRGFDPAYRRDLQGFGAVSVRSADLNADSHPDLVLINRLSGSRGTIDSLIYWGNPHHYYSQAALSAVLGAMGAAATADVDQDGWVDLIFSSGLIYGGGPEGYDPARRQDLQIDDAHGVSTADLNRDGYLDLVIPTGIATASGSTPTGLLLWGSPQGYRSEHRTELKLTVSLPQSANIADFNKDGFLDLIFTDVDRDNIDIFWGSASGNYGEKRRHLNVHSASTVEIADLNSDGWLDLVLGGVYDHERFGRPMQVATLLWGSPQGFAAENASQLEAYESEEQAVADLNRDGHLDIVMTNYHGYTTRSIPFFIYWGGPGGSYHESRRTSLPGESSLALSVLDLNRDGWLDIFVINHVQRGDHGAGAHIYWGGPEGFSTDRSHWLQTFGPHFSTRRDVGNIYHRRLEEEEYLSPTLRVPVDRTPCRLEWQARTPNGTAVLFQLRGAESKEGLSEASWIGVAGPGSYFTESPAQLHLLPAHSWLQYCAVLTTPDGGSTPVLDEVKIEGCKP